MFPFSILFDLIIFRRNPIAYVISLAVFFLILVAILFMTMGTGKKAYSLGEFSDDLAVMTGMRAADGRPALSGHLPPAPQGWVRRAYLRSDGEAITAGAGALGWTARLRAAGDLERFGVFAQSGPDQMVKVLANGETRIAIGLRRPPKMLKADRTPWAVATLVGEEKMEVDAVVEAAGLKFERRARALPDTGAPMPYDVYRGRGPGGLEIEVLTNAPAETVAATLAGLVVLQR